MSEKKMPFNIAIFSGTHEFVTIKEIQRFILPLIPPSKNVNEFYSFRCPYCCLPVTYNKSNNKSHYFRHMGDLKDKDCPVYTGNKGQEMSPDFTEIIKWNYNFELFKNEGFKRITQWVGYNTFQNSLPQPRYFKYLDLEQKSNPIFLWVFQIFQFFEIISNQNKKMDLLKKIDFFANIADFSENIIFLHYNEIEDDGLIDEAVVKTYFSRILDNNSKFLIFETNSRPIKFFPCNRIWGNFEDKKDPQCLLNRSFQFLEENDYSYKKIKEIYLGQEPLFKPKNREVLIAYLEKNKNCPRCKRKYFLVVELRTSLGNPKISRSEGLFGTIYSQYFCSNCKMPIFDKDQWVRHVKKTSKNALKIKVGDRIELIYGDFRGRKGTVLKKSQQDLIIKIKLDEPSIDIINQSVYFAKKLKT